MKRALEAVGSALFRPSRRRRDNSGNAIPVISPPSTTRMMSPNNHSSLAEYPPPPSSSSSSSSSSSLNHSHLYPPPLCSETADSSPAKGKPATKGEASSTPSTPPQRQQSPLLQTLPSEVLRHCLTFVASSPRDHHTLQTLCRHFRFLASSPEILGVVDIRGDMGGKGGVIMEDDTPRDAQDRLVKFALAQNMEAYYQLGMIRAYCFEDVRGAIALLRVASSHGHVRSSYALGLILRDSQREIAGSLFTHAASLDFLPATQEIMPARAVKARHGDLTAEALSKFLDAACVNRLLQRHYRSSFPDSGANHEGSALVRDLGRSEEKTSHCWNIHCGRWAYRRPNRRVAMGGGCDAEPSEEDGEKSPSTVLDPNRFDPIVASLLERTKQIHGDRCKYPLPKDVEEALDSSGSSGDDDSSSGNTDDSTVRTVVEKVKVSRMKMCSSCHRAKYCSKLCQVYDWRSGRHKNTCNFNFMMRFRVT